MCFVNNIFVFFFKEQMCGFSAQVLMECSKKKIERSKRYGVDKWLLFYLIFDI